MGSEVYGARPPLSHISLPSRSLALALGVFLTFGVVCSKGIQPQYARSHPLPCTPALHSLPCTGPCTPCPAHALPLHPATLAVHSDCGYGHTQTDRQTAIQTHTDRQTNRHRQTDTFTDTETTQTGGDTHTHRHTCGHADVHAEHSDRQTDMQTDLRHTDMRCGQRQTYLQCGHQHTDRQTA